jgi:hypothetical protein
MHPNPKPVIQLLLGLFCIYIVIQGLVPFVLRYTKLDWVEKVKEQGLDTGALFYSNSEEAVEANFEMMKAAHH